MTGELSSSGAIVAFSKSTNTRDEAQPRRTCSLNRGNEASGVAKFRLCPFACVLASRNLYIHILYDMCCLLHSPLANFWPAALSKCVHTGWPYIQLISEFLPTVSQCAFGVLIIPPTLL